MEYSNTYLAYMGLAPKIIPHWEHWSNPDAETQLTGIDYYEHPRLCRLKIQELYPQLGLHVPESDAPKPRPRAIDLEAGTVRWGDAQTDSFVHGEKLFKTPEDVFAYSPLEHADMRTHKHVVENWDFTSEETITAHLKARYPGEWTLPPIGSTASCGFYNTTFMWPLLTFGWELFLECCLDEEFERIMDEFAEINRRVFRVMAKTPTRFIVCHDDITTSRGPVCSPAWMHKYVYPRYEEFWSILKEGGKEVIFMADGRMDIQADNIMACGARGIISEPYTDYKSIARRYKDCFVAGEGDNRILFRNDPDEIRAMVDSMVETSRMTGGYMMCIGNHIPWNIPASAIKLYLDYSSEVAVRE